MSSQSAPLRCLLRPINPDSQKDVASVSNMHLELLGQREAAGMGKLFLERFFYRTLVKNGMMHVSLYEVNEKPVGFFAYTPCSQNFHRSALKKHFFYFAFLSLLSIFSKPSDMFDLIRAMMRIRLRRSVIDDWKDKEGEILAIGVLPEYRRLKCCQRTGLRISEELFMSAVFHLKSIGLKRLDAFVDADNTHILLFYKSLGGILKPYNRAGISLYRVFFELNQLNLSE